LANLRAVHEWFAHTYNNLGLPLLGANPENSGVFSPARLL
jgi:hypothetical protein